MYACCVSQELRFEDYQAGRKGPTGGTGLFGQGVQGGLTGQVGGGGGGGGMFNQTGQGLGKLRMLCEHVVSTLPHG